MATMLCYACVTCLLALDLWIVVGPRSPVCLVVLHDFETSRPFDGRPHVFDNYCRDTVVSDLKKALGSSWVKRTDVSQVATLAQNKN